MILNDRNREQRDLASIRLPRRWQTRAVAIRPSGTFFTGSILCSSRTLRIALLQRSITSWLFAALFASHHGEPMHGRRSVCHASTE